MAVSCLTAKWYLITCITSPFLEKGLGLRWRMPTCISKWRCQLGCTQGQGQSVVCRATAPGTFGYRDGFLVPSCLLGHSPSIPRMLLCHPLHYHPARTKGLSKFSTSCCHTSPTRSGRIDHLVWISVYLHTFTSLVLYLNLGFLEKGEGPFCTGHRDKKRTSVSRAATQRLNHVSE